jgi:hypothetical protein
MFGTQPSPSGFGPPANFCDWTMPPQQPGTLWFRANDDGTTNGAVMECDGKNDLLYLPYVSCFQPG